ncbi:MAG: hypothetical protein K8F52_01450 [Candidatus Scalindua rubra]|uniref:Uncharacterized protein n=1 Tax=Candidatus Scalindua brodae TaxID=237368 RepID=A0A0B0EHZ6_9BACT|nr:MAG: hypothetical protein SCABRO_02089 [Candidatus Scalindua brodae]MBZ0107308.1 hypothetical protein [Candidatus Scalindua rubra]TWU32067.1 hypothetical protein S225a_18310 [Candidatus Brocadiaceae bacterium S225]
MARRRTSKKLNLSFYLRPDLFKRKVSDIDDLKKDEREYVEKKLDEYLRSEILRIIGPEKPGIEKLLKKLKLDSLKLKEEDLNTVIKEKLLAKATRNNKLKKEIKEVEKLLEETPSVTVANVLRLDMPLRDHPVLAPDYRKKKTAELARIIDLKDDKADRLAEELEEKELDIDYANRATLNEFVEKKILTEKQKKELLITIDLSRLGGGNIELIEALKSDKLKSLEEFVTWEESDWVGLIEDVENKISLPEGEESAKIYAGNIRKNIEKTFPSPYFLKRVIKKKSDFNSEIKLLDSVSALFKNNDTIIDGKSINTKKLNWKGISSKKIKKIENDLEEFLPFANTYRELGIAEIVNDKSLNIKKKKDAITNRLANLETFYKNNTNLDLALTDFADNRARFIWDDIDKNERPRVRKQLMVYQRLFNLTEDSETARKLLNKGYHSGMDITNTAEGDFVKASGLDREKGRDVYNKAMKTSIAASHLFEAVRDVHSGLFKDIAVSNIVPMNNELSHIDGFDELFGRQNFCDCEHCRSVLGPAAYFADLMYFVQENVSKKAFEPDPMDHDLYLKNRRPDLWELQLTCQNTSTEIPYLEVVNDVLERYLSDKSILPDVYDWLREWESLVSMNLPFNLPLEELRLYLSHYELSLYDVYRLLKKPDESKKKQLGERLKISEEELKIITTPNTDGAHRIFGNIVLPTNFDVQDFVRYAGINRKELDDLLKSEFLSEISPDIVQVKVELIEKQDDIQQYEEFLQNLTESHLDLIHRFVRFWKKTSWTIREFDLVLNSLKSANLLDNLEDGNGYPKILQVSELTIIEEVLSLSVEEMCAMVGDIPQTPIEENQKGLYERLFDLEEIFGVDTDDEEIPPLLMAGLGISESELEALYILVDPDNNLPLDSTLISNLFRHARIARSLSLSIEDLIHAIELTLNGSPVSTLSHILDLIEFTSWLKSSPFSVSELIMILEGKESRSLKYRNDINTAVDVVLEIQRTFEKDRRSRINDYLKNTYSLTSSQVEVLKSSTYTISEIDVILKKIDSLSAEIYSGNNSLLTAGIQQIGDSIKRDKKKLLKEYLQSTFNITAVQLEDEILPNFVSVDIDGLGIIRALDAVFTNDGEPVDPGDFDELVVLVREIERVGLLFSNLRFDAESITYFIENKTVFGIDDLKELTLNNLKNASFYKSLVETNREMEGEIGELLKNYQPNKIFSVEDIKTLSDLWQQPEEQIKSLKDSLTFDPNDSALEAVKFILEAQEVCQELGIRGDSLIKLTDTDSEGLRAAREIAIGAFASRYTEEKVREEKLEPYVDKINMLKRDALCDFILTRQEQFKFNDRRDLYNYFLLDVEMSGCFRTSKVVAAISSVQLYIHRCLINLKRSENLFKNPAVVARDVDPTLIPADEWEWRKNYRVWEANRKVFLYPENYIDPTLRDNKTHIFKELEEELLQEKITQESAETAYKKYISQFAELTKLRYAGAYYHSISKGLSNLDLSGPGKIKVVYKFLDGLTYNLESEESLYYLFARTNVDPYQYYYRTYNHYKEAWGNWKKIELAIEAKEISVLIYRGKLYIYWTEVNRKEIKKIVGGSSVPGGTEFKVYAKYSFLNENDTWSTPQRLYVGYTHFEDGRAYWRIVGEELRTEKENESDEYTKNRKKQENQHDYVFDQFEQKVFRKPYTTFYNNINTPITLSYIWSQNQIVQRKVRYFVLEQNFQWPVEYENRTASGTTFTTTYTYIFTIPPFEFEASNNLQISVKEIKVTINGPSFDDDEQLDALVYFIGPTTCTIFIRFDPKGGNDDELAIKLLRVFSSMPPENTIYTSTFKQSLSENKIVNNSELDIKDKSSNYVDLSNSSAEFLRKEYKEAYTEDGNYSQYIENGTKSFADKEKILTQLRWGQGHLSIPGAFFGTDAVSLTTILTDELSDILFAKGLEQFLSLETQQLADNSGQKLDFNGAYGEYYWEMYFHIPFLIANHLNANSKFKEAKWWYDRIFDPTADESPTDTKHSDHNWQFREFRNLDIQKLKDILVDSAAIETYKKDPFNPHAIARLRLNSYQKAVVMKYIDNLIDWGDNLFAQDTRESINEANMLYQLAADILGKRPAKVGTCKTASDDDLAYENIGPAIEKGSAFLITLENFYAGLRYRYDFDVKLVKKSKYLASLLDNAGVRPKTNSLAAVAKAANITRLSDKFASVPVVPGGVPAAPAGSGNYTIKLYADIVKTEKPVDGIITDWTDAKEYEDKMETEETSRAPSLDIVKQSVMVFCVPHNSDLLRYWDRVEDRLFKIRHCMNISGVRRSLALFQPPIDPMLLVRARAAGLSLEDITDMLAASNTIPPYRFVYLIEKTRQFTQTVQSFGNSLLSALEKKDVEELTLLRSVHERNILKMSREIKKRQLKESQHQYKSMEDALANVQNRIDYYVGLIEDDLTGWETTQQASKHTATSIKAISAIYYAMSSKSALTPQYGSPFSINFGGIQINQYAKSSGNKYDTAASILDLISQSAGLEATFQRREQEWKQQLRLAETEYKQIEKQMLAAEIRSLIAEKDLEIHEKSMEQADELNDFYRDKFTNLGLYNYLASTLNRLYRESYNMAYDMAKMSERAYQFERDDSNIFIANDNWQSDRAGLLAGERLLLQLQEMEQKFIENNVRTPEITQSFSLALLDASELVNLRQTGSCTIRIPEIAFEVYYPGQYKRLIKSVRISIPCVVGPYTNVSAKLTLINSKVKSGKDDSELTPLEIGKNTSISASSANSDTGMFEFNFRDERYLPFEGSGAISEWTVELPSTVRSFNYDTIPDVIMHISYTAKDGDRETAESNLSTTITTYATEHGLFRLFSLKHEFPNAFHQLLNPQDGGAQATEISVDSSHFPYLFIDKTLNITEAKVYFKPKKGLSIISIPTMGFNGVNAEWNTDVDIAMPGRSEEKDKMKGGTLSINGRNPIDEWTINTDDNGLDGNVLEDILILIKYRIS